MLCYRLVSTLLVALTSGALAEDLAESHLQAAQRARISIIIDDLGYSLAPGKILAAMPWPITFAIIPFTPHGAHIAELAHTKKKEVMLHAPMETLTRRKWELALNVNMDEQELFRTIDTMLTDIPYVKGVNNHGGSKLTQDRNRMDWVMSYLAQRQLYFIDSRTIASTTAAAAAKGAALAYRSRDLFLDNDRSPEQIHKQLEKLRMISLDKGEAIGIGHPYPETLQTLRKTLPRFQREGIHLVSVSQIVFRDSGPPRFFIAIKSNSAQ